MLALVDGDILVYRCGFAAQKTEHSVVDSKGTLVGEFDNKLDANKFLEEAGDPALEIVSTVIEEPLSHALQNVRVTMQMILDNVGTNEHITYLSGKDNFREKIATLRPYKGNRDPMHKPVHYQAIKDYILAEQNGKLVDGMEADDALGINQCEAMDLGIETIICSTDKDLDMIPGWHYNWVKGSRYLVSDQMGLTKFYTQLLTGDPTDNIGGAKGIGPAKAAKLLDGLTTEEEMYAKCVEAYKGNLVELNENAQLLWIRRAADDVWVPPT